MKEKDAWELPAQEVSATHPSAHRPGPLAQRRLRVPLDRPMIMTTDERLRGGLTFARRDDVESVSQTRPRHPRPRPTHKAPTAPIGRDVHYLQRAVRGRTFTATLHLDLTMLDPAPRVVLDAELGLMHASAKPLKTPLCVRDIYQHTMAIIERAERLESYQALSAQGYLRG